MFAVLTTRLARETFIVRPPILVFEKAEVPVLLAVSVVSVAVALLKLTGIEVVGLTAALVVPEAFSVVIVPVLLIETAIVVDER